MAIYRSKMDEKKQFFSSENAARAGQRNPRDKNGSGSGAKKRRLDAGQAWEKIKPYCAYQERCHSEARDKLLGYGLPAQEAAQLLSRLIEENYLNEERFAQFYAGGHSRIKKWGKIKIAHALKLKGVSPYCIKTALEAIDPEAYLSGLYKLALQKWETNSGQPAFARRSKCMQYLLQKGYESNLINDVLNELEKE